MVGWTMTTFVWVRKFQVGQEQQEKGHKDWGYLSTSAKHIPDWERLTFEDETLIPLRWVYWLYPDNISFWGQLRPKFYNTWNLKWKRSFEKNCTWNIRKCTASRVQTSNDCDSDLNTVWVFRLWTYIFNRRMSNPLVFVFCKSCGQFPDKKGN